MYIYIYIIYLPADPGRRKGERARDKEIPASAGNSNNNNNNKKAKDNKADPGRCKGQQQRQQQQPISFWQFHPLLPWCFPSCFCWPWKHGFLEATLATLRAITLRGDEFPAVSSFGAIVFFGSRCLW